MDTASTRLTAAAIMQVDVVRLQPSCTLREALYAMTQARARYALVERDGVLDGLISDRDLRLVLPSRLGSERTDEPHRLLDETTIEAVRIQRPFSVGPRDHASTVARLMLTKRVGCLPVVNAQRRVLGIVTLDDFARVFAGLANAADEPAPSPIRSLVA